LDIPGGISSGFTGCETSGFAGSIPVFTEGAGAGRTMGFCIGGTGGRAGGDAVLSGLPGGIAAGWPGCDGKGRPGGAATGLGDDAAMGLPAVLPGVLAWPCAGGAGGAAPGTGGRRGGACAGGAPGLPWTFAGAGAPGFGR
jgi:hypothetical protein